MLAMKLLQYLKKFFLEDKPHPKGDEMYGALQTKQRSNK